MLASLPQTVVFAALTLLWWAEFLLFPSPGRGEGKGRDPSFVRIFQAIVLSLAVALMLSLLGWGNLPVSWSGSVGAGALAVYALGLLVRYWSLLTLGSWFSRHVTASGQQELVSRGPYRYLRHPSYLGLFLLGLGALLFIRNLPGLLLGGGLIYGALSQRMEEEEQLMEETLGERYWQWKRGRGRMFPRLF